MLNAYQERNRVLKLLGYSSYYQYLRSDLWARIRLKVLIAANYQCTGCKGRATEVHHASYTKAILVGRRNHLKYLKAVCRNCHQRIEFYRGKKRGQARVTRALYKLSKGYARIDATSKVQERQYTLPSYSKIKGLLSAGEG